MDTKLPLVSIVVPTTACASRAPALQRAIESIREAASVPVRIIAAVNGLRADEQTLAWLQSQPDVQVDYSVIPSLTGALRRGRNLVETPYFGFLDDDDEYSNRAIDKRLQVLCRDLAIDVVVSKGQRRLAGSTKEVMGGIASIEGRPLEALFELTWLCSCNGLYRAATIGPTFFEYLHERAEWTWLAFDMSRQGRRIAVLDEPTFVINDTPDSLSKGDAYAKAYTGLFARMLGQAKNPQIRRLIQRRLAAEFHDQSVRALGKGDYRQAAQAHLRSLLIPGGMRYLGYTRRLLWTSRSRAP